MIAFTRLLVHELYAQNFYNFFSSLETQETFFPFKKKKEIQSPKTLLAIPISSRKHTDSVFFSSRPKTRYLLMGFLGNEDSKCYSNWISNTQCIATQNIKETHTTRRLCQKNIKIKKKSAIKKKNVTLRWDVIGKTWLFVTMDSRKHVNGRVETCKKHDTFYNFNPFRSNVILRGR